MEHAGEHADQEGAVHGVVVLSEVPVVRDAGKVEVGGGGPGEDALSPADVEDKTRHWDPGSVDTGEEQLQLP